MARVVDAGFPGETVKDGAGGDGGQCGEGEWTCE